MRRERSSSSPRATMDFRALPPQRRQGIGRSHAGPDTRFGKRRSDRFAIFCQSLQLLGETDRSFHLGFAFRLRQPKDWRHRRCISVLRQPAAVPYWHGGFERCQAEEGSELTPAGEGAGVLDRGPDRRGGDRPTPGMVINRLAVSSALTDAASSLSIAPIASSSASIWPTSERSAPRTQSGTTISPFSLKPSTAMRFSP